MSNVISRTVPAPVTVSGSTAQTTLATTTIPSNLFAANGRSARLDLLAKVVANTTAPSVVLRGKLGSTAAEWSSTISPTSGSTSYLTILARLQASSSALQEHWVTLTHSTSVAIIVGQSTQDYDSSLAWTITAQLNSTSTALAVSLVGGTVELVR